MVQWASDVLGLTRAQPTGVEATALPDSAADVGAAIFKDAEGRHIFTHFLF